jgi:HK97 gp10 family phage protein
VSLIGADELRRKLGNLTEQLTKSEARQVFRAAGQPIRDQARRNAPAGKNIAYSVLGSRRTFERRKGNLRRSIIVWAPRKSKEPAAYVSVQIFRGKNFAPHGHMIEFGTKERKPETAKFLVFANKSNTALVFKRRVAGVKPRPYFAPAVAAKGEAALEAATAKTADLLQKFIDRN